MLKTVELRYGRGILNVNLPEGAEPMMIRKTAMTKLPDAAAAVRQALAQPVAAPSLKELAKGRKSACIVICDITRPVPNHLFLRPMIATMTEAGIPRERITILVANGLHRCRDDGELAELVNDPWVLERVRIVNHDARDSSSLVDLGVTPTRGTPVHINRLLVEADLRIVTGLVEPHFMAGWSGGRKVVAPGVAGEQTIRTFHSTRFMSNPLATGCNLAGNPLHEEQLEITKMIGELYGLNTVIDEERDLTAVTFGEVEASHLGIISACRESFLVRSPRRFHTILTSAAGYPLDKTYYQTVKGMVTPIDILEPGGTIIIVSACSTGFGSDEYRKAQQELISLGADAFFEMLQTRKLAEIDEWQTEKQLAPMRLGKIQLYSTGLNAAEQLLTGVEPIESVDEAVAQALANSPDNALAVIPEGPYVIPVFDAST
ncbi:MAG: nickel-dependent lactate racemase [Propionibacteriaceae bacterium]|nr:nickel-dependent lactate racemase [Propionibacteriaceae bacterium]